MKQCLQPFKVILLVIVLGFSLGVTAQTFNYTGSVQTYTVPPGVFCISVDVQGAAGGMAGPMIPPVGITTPGKGGRVTATLAVTPGTVLDIYVGGVGEDGTIVGCAGGYNGGGNTAGRPGIVAGYSGGGGGGASDIRIPPYGLANRVVVGAGGGGAAYDGSCPVGDQPGGDGGGTTGADAITCDATIISFGYSVIHAGGGTPVAGGVGGWLFPGYSAGAPGTFGIGGDNQATAPDFDGGIGGGGGGGWYGGGGGCWMGGGGGSSYIDAVLGTSVVHTPGFRSGNGIVIISTGLAPTAGLIVGPSSFCVGATATYTNPTATPGFVWSTSDPSIATIGAGTGIATGISAGVVDIICTVTTACGTASTTKTVTVNALPVVAPISGPTTVCVGATITMSDATPGGVWSVTNAHATIVPGTGVVTGVTVGLDTIKYSVTNSCGTTVATYTVNVITTPSPGVITGPSAVCTGLTITLTDATPGGVWSAANTHATVAGGVVLGVTPGLDTIYYTVTNACGSAFAMQTVNVLSSPTAGTITGPVAVCETATITLFDGVPGGVWGTSNSNATVTGGGVVTGVSAGPVTIFYSVTNICGTATASYPIDVFPLPNAGTITGPSVVCEAATITVADAVGGGSWSMKHTNATISIGGIVTGVTAGLDTVVYAKSNACGIATALYPVTVNPLPQAGTITGSPTVCVGAGVTLNDAAPGGIWLASNLKATISGIGDVTGWVIGLDTISYSVTNSCGTAVATKTITVIDVPVVAAITGSPTVCPGATITLHDATPGGVWDKSNSSVTVSSGGVVTGVTSGTTVISYTVTNSCGTTTVTKSLEILVSPSTLTITGDTVVCPDQYDPFTASIPGGTWSILNTHAFIDETGVVGGVHQGWDTVVYTVTNACGTGTVSFPVYVLSDSICHPVYVQPISGVETSMKVYPNPNQGSFTMLLTSGINEQVTVTITNVIGEKLKSFETKTNKATDIVSNLPAGIYILNATTAHGRYVAKVTVE